MRKQLKTKEDTRGVNDLGVEEAVREILERDRKHGGDKKKWTKLDGNGQWAK